MTKPFRSAAARVVPSGLISQRDDGPCGTLQCGVLPAGGQLPDPYDRVNPVSQSQKAAVGRDRQRAESSSRGRDRQLLAAARQVPDPDRVVAARSGDVVPSRRERERGDEIGMPVESRHAGTSSVFQSVIWPSCWPMARVPPSGAKARQAAAMVDRGGVVETARDGGLTRSCRATGRPGCRLPEGGYRG